MNEINYEKQLYLWIKNREYSENTWNTYKDILRKVLFKFPNIENESLNNIKEYCSEIKNVNTRRNTCMIIRWIFDKVLHKSIDFRSLPYPKRIVTIQPIYTQEESLAILKTTKNEKQKCILALIINCGLRVSEPCSIFLTDCNSKEEKIIIRQAKGKKDRIIYPSKEVWNLIKVYWKTLKEKPKKYLFEGQFKETPYTPISIRQFVKRSCKIAKIEYKGIHAFRRFSASWMVENGIPETVVIDKLGQNSVKTLHKHYLIHNPSYLRNLPRPQIL